MFHNVLMTSLTPLRDTNEVHHWDNRPFTTIWPESKQEKSKETNIKKTIKKKNKRYRTMFTTEQVRELEKVFARSKYIDVERRREIAGYLQMDQKCIKIWFQNRRMKEKKELSESCESASESVAESVSPPLCVTEVSQPSNYHQDSQYFQNYSNQIQITQPSYNYYPTDNYQNVRPFPCFYHAPNNYCDVETVKNEPISKDTQNNLASPKCENIVDLDANEFKNNAGYPAQHFIPDTGLNYYYNNLGYVNNQCPNSNVQEWPVNTFYTSYI